MLKIQDFNNLKIIKEHNSNYLIKNNKDNELKIIKEHNKI